MSLHLQSFTQQSRRAYESIAVHLSETNELCPLETRNELQHALLLAVLEMALKAHDVVGIGHEILESQLHCRIRLASGARILQPDGLHWAEPESIAPSPRQLFDR